MLSRKSLWFSTVELEKPEFGAERLKGRSVLSIKGADAEGFLQELTTNDVRQLEVGPSMFTLFLNGRGRVIHDAIIYKGKDDTFYIDCDIASVQALQVHMIMFRARKEVKIKSVEHELATWSIFSPKEAEKYINKCQEEDEPDNICRDEPNPLDEIELGENIIVSRDPRIWALGLRILAPKEMDVIHTIKNLGLKVKAIPNLYKTIRYKLGIGEGTSEVGYGRCLPAEVNGDYLHGIDVNKGSYIGFVPDVKKRNVDTRLMPIMVNTVHLGEIPVNTPIEDARGRKKAPVGYLRGLQGSLGLGLMNVSGALQYKNVKIGKILMQVLKPPWWK
ncbi:putative transferase CAF17 homolog, mitochondrial [Cimex lectularius]|uniref:Aminomethyltransferase folate-binding domain-containing protein n=1 Tax=Cimex lectularius TaxID=79782 RepID=A0A8I6S3Z6_CIMLE|nr:putative transferase CAF17 homolog, mitochondrial [Cimex lectularius]